MRVVHSVYSEPIMAVFDYRVSIGWENGEYTQITDLKTPGPFKHFYMTCAREVSEGD